MHFFWLDSCISLDPFLASIRMLAGLEIFESRVETKSPRLRRDTIQSLALEGFLAGLDSY